MTALMPAGGALRSRLDGTPLLVMLDVDGTLAPITSRPEEAVVPPETRRAVAALAAHDGVIVALVSGRSASDARRMVAVANVWVIGNHGCEVVSPDGENAVDPGVEPFRSALARTYAAIASQTAPVEGVIAENKVWTLSVHYRLADPGVVPRLRATVDDIVRRHGLVMTEGKAIFEVRPPVDVHKGTAVLALAERLGGLARGASLVFIGDDRTDEDAFRSLRERGAAAVTVRVTGSEMGTDLGTAAEYAAPDPETIREFLEWLAAERP
ncbi:MAG: trehalose-phosphatase [Gemmatimonadaceae bacterium]